MATDIERRFNDAMLEIYRRAKCEAGYDATGLLSMVVEHGGLYTRSIPVACGFCV